MLSPSIVRYLSLAIILSIALLNPATTQALTTITVDSNGDTVDGGDGVTTLREAIATATNTNDDVNIEFDLGFAVLSPATSYNSIRNGFGKVVTVDGQNNIYWELCSARARAY